MTPTELRLQIAREYTSKVKEAMDGALMDAYVFGSVARGEAEEHSDIDIMVVVKRPSREERYLWNSALELEKREYIRNFAKNSHQLFLIGKELEEKHGVPISYYWHYEDSADDERIYLSESAFVPFNEIISGAIRI